MRVLFSGGLPYTPFDVDRSLEVANWDTFNAPLLEYDLLNTERNGAFHQVDLRLDRKWFFDQWSLDVFMDVQNLTGAVPPQRAVPRTGPRPTNPTAHSPQPIASTDRGPPTDQARPRVNRSASAGRTGPALKGRYIPAQGSNPGYRVYPPPTAPCRGATYCTSYTALCPRPFRGRGMGGYAVPPGRCPTSANYLSVVLSIGFGSRACPAP